jgi:hypothetical protein
MPLPHYGVVLGTFGGFRRDDPDEFGKYYHGHVTVNLPGGETYNCAVDVDTHNDAIHVEWRLQHLRPAEWAGVFGLADGFHPLASNDTSGAADYFRDGRLYDVLVLPDVVAGPRPPWWPVPPVVRIPLWDRVKAAARLLFAGTPPAVAQPRMTLLSHGARQVVRLPHVWKKGGGGPALDDLEAMMAGTVRVAVFGDRYPPQGNRPAGIHDIHQNQGDPAGTPWYASNAPWQDGLTVAIRPDGSATAFMNKFSSQAYETDDQGHPLP